MESATYLSVAERKNDPSLRHEPPIDYLYAHGFELFLKGALLLSGRDLGVVQKFSHNLIKLYDEVENETRLEGLISTAEKHVKTKWKSRLRSARDDHKTKLQKFGLSEPDTQELGCFDNATIGDALPELRPQVQWLNDRHTRNGGLFRYYPTERKDQFYQRQQITVFDLSDDVVRLSMEWTCGYLDGWFRANYRQVSK